MKALKIFIVEDDPFYRDLLKGCLRNIGYTDVYTYSSGDECVLNLYRQPDVILLDHNLDGKNGIETLKSIKGYDPEIFVVYVSGQKDLQIAIDSLKYGSFDYITKDPKVHERLEKVLNRISKLQEEFRQRSRLSGIKSFITNLNIF